MTLMLAKYLQELQNLLYPPACFLCKERVDMFGYICASCWKKIDFISHPMCEVCSHPLPYAETGVTECAACIRQAPPYQKARVLFSYTEHSKTLIHQFKYKDKTHLAPHLAKWCLQAREDILEEIDLIAPVPLHRYRLIARRYNQSALLCSFLSKEIEVEAKNDLLIRTRHTRPQSGLTRNQRKKNVQGVFTFNHRYLEEIQDKKILLIDDVITTGATIHACTKTLLKAGAKEVNVLALGKTVS